MPQFIRLTVTDLFFVFSIATGKNSEISSWSSGWPAPDDSNMVSADVVQHVDIKSVLNLPVQASCDSVCEPSARHQQDWSNMEALHQTVTLPVLDSPALNDPFPAQLSTNLPAPAYLSVGSLASRGHAEPFEACNRPADYVTVAALPSRAVSPPEVPTPPLIPSMPPPQPHLPTDAILVRPRLGLIAGHTSSSMVAGSHLVFIPPPLTGDPVAPASPYISVNSTQLEPAIGNTEIYGSGFFVQPSLSSPPVHSVEEENNMVGAPTLCDRCGSQCYPPHAWTPILPVFQPPPHVAMPPCFPVATTGIVARPPPLTQNAPVAAPALPTAFRLPNPGMVTEMILPAPVIMPPSGHVSPMGVVGGAPVGVAPGVTAIRLRAAPLCSNCGASGHIYAECKEPTIDAVLSTGIYRYRHWIVLTWSGYC